MEVAGFTNAIDMLVEGQLPIQSDAETFDCRRRLNSGVRYPNGFDVISSLSSSTSGKLELVRLLRVELEAVVKQPGVNTSGTSFESIDLCGQFSFQRRNIDLRVVGILMVRQTERTNHRGQRRNV
jgi:hypothetical protein